MLMAQNPSLSASEVTRLIVSHVDPFTGPADRPLAPGAGRINVRRALAAASATEGVTMLAGLVFSQSRVEGGQPVIATVALTGPAPAPELPIQILSGSLDLLDMPTEVRIPGGETSVSFAVNTRAVAALTPVTLTVEGLSGRATATLVLEPGAGTVTRLALDPAVLTGGQATRATFTVSRPAPPGGARIAVASDRPDLVPLPESVVVPEGATSLVLPLATFGVGAETSVQLSASMGGVTESASITLLPPAVSAVHLRPNVSRINRVINVTVSLEGPAPAGGMELKVLADRPEMIENPGVIRVPEGAREVTFKVLAQPARVQTPVQIAVTSGGGGRASLLTILPSFLGTGAAAR